MERSLDVMLAGVAAKQAGAFSIAQARGVGLRDHHVRHRVETGRWLKRLPRTFVLAGSADCPRQRMVLGYLWGGDNAVVSHWTAAWVWGLCSWREPVDITLSVRRDKPADGISLHRSAIEACDVESRGDVNLFNATRVLIDLAGTMDAPTLEVMLDEALRLGRTSLPRLSWRLQQVGRGSAGSGALKELLRKRLPGGLSESALETLMGQVLRDMKKRSLPLPQRQFPVRLEALAIKARLDFAFPAFKVGLEGDGRRWHGVAQWHDDLRRENAFQQAGWDVRRFSWFDATRDTSYILDQAEAALRLAGWRPPIQGRLA